MEIAFNAEPLSMINAINKPCQHMSALINNDNKKDFNPLYADLTISHERLRASVNIGNTGNTWWNFS